MIYIAGDTHSDFSRFTEENFLIQSEMTKDDYAIIQKYFIWLFTIEFRINHILNMVFWTLV